MRAILICLPGLLAAPLAAQSSHCAALPATARVEVRAPDTLVPAQLTSGGLQCPRGFAIEVVGEKTRCRRAGASRVEDREPRRDCYANLPIGPVEAVTGLLRPSLRCPTGRGIETLVAIRGPNVGWDDVTLTVPPASAISLGEPGAPDSATPKASSRATPQAPDRVVQDCFPHSCRMVRLTTRAGTPARVELTLATPGRASSTTIALLSEAVCPGQPGK